MTLCPIPTKKDDLATAELLPMYDGTVSDKEYRALIDWLKDENWPVFAVVVEFLVKRGVATEPAINDVLKSKNGLWKKNVIQHVLSTWPKDDLTSLSVRLTGLVTDPDPYGPDLVTARLLLDHQLIDSEWLKQWLEHKKKTLSEKVADVEELLGAINH